MKDKIQATQEDILYGNMGACLACGEITDSVEPDATKYKCPNCGKNEVYGLETLLLMDKVEIIEEDE